jgi:cytidine deaminase
MAEMVEMLIERAASIVAVWKDKDGVVYILSPCGGCREFIAQIHSADT